MNPAGEEPARREAWVQSGSAVEVVLGWTLDGSLAEKTGQRPVVEEERGKEKGNQKPQEKITNCNRSQRAPGTTEWAPTHRGEWSGQT